MLDLQNLDNAKDPHTKSAGIHDAPKVTLSTKPLQETDWQQDYVP